MKNKIIVLLSAILFCMTLGVKDAMAAAATDVACKAPCINSYEIQDGQVGGADIADGAVTNTKISDGAVTGTKIQDSSVTGADIQDGSIGGADIAIDAIGSNHISDGSVSSMDVGFNYAGSATKGGPASDLSCTGCVSQEELGFFITGPLPTVWLWQQAAGTTQASAQPY